MRAGLVLGVGLAGLVATQALAAPQGDAAELIHAYKAENVICRAVDRQPATNAACERRSLAHKRLDAMGWCLGQRGQGGAEMTWHHCTAASYHYGD